MTGSRAGEALVVVAVTQAPGVLAPVVVVGAQREEGGHVGLCSLGWMNLVAVRVGRFTVVSQPRLRKPDTHLYKTENIVNIINKSLLLLSC